MPRGLVGSGYYGAYSPDSYSHSACLAEFRAVDHDGIANYNMPDVRVRTSGGYYHGPGRSKSDDLLQTGRSELTIDKRPRSAGRPDSQGDTAGGEAPAIKTWEMGTPFVGDWRRLRVAKREIDG